MSERSIAEILGDLDTANQRLGERRRLEDEARAAATAALNEVNRLQKELDARLLALRKEAPRDSDWCRQVGPGIPVPYG